MKDLAPITDEKQNPERTQNILTEGCKILHAQIFFFPGKIVFEMF